MQKVSNFDLIFWIIFSDSQLTIMTSDPLAVTSNVCYIYLRCLYKLLTENLQTIL